MGADQRVGAARRSCTGLRRWYLPAPTWFAARNWQESPNLPCPWPCRMAFIGLSLSAVLCRTLGGGLIIASTKQYENNMQPLAAGAPCLLPGLEPGPCFASLRRITATWLVTRRRQPGLVRQAGAEPASAGPCVPAPKPCAACARLSGPPSVFPLCLRRVQPPMPKRLWWTRPGLNREHTAYEAAALPLRHTSVE